MRYDLNHIKLCGFLAETRGKFPTGAQALLILAAQPAKVFDPLELSLRMELHRADPGLILALLDSAFTSVPHCDARALREYHHRVDQLEEKRAELLRSQAEPDLEELDWELAFLNAEIRRNTKPRGGIKNLNPTLKHAWLRLKNSFSRLTARAEAKDPALAEYIRRHLQTAYGFAWHGERIDLPERAAPTRKLPLAA
ncbi:MAG: hypothetical protein ACP5F3_07435 [Candidatus Syntrophosphaera sp.]